MRVLGVLEFPGMVALAFAQARIVIVRVQVFEDAGEDLRQPIIMSVHRELLNAWDT